MAFTCEASITSLIDNHLWYYTACPICFKKIHEQEDKYVCTNDKEQTPTYMHCLAAIIEDLSGSIIITIFNQPATLMIGITCTDMVIKYGHSNPNIIPLEIETIKGKIKVFQLQQPQRTNKCDVRFSINQVFETTAIIGTPSTAVIGTPSSQLAARTGQAPETPAATEQQHAPAKRQLFQTPGESISDTKKVRYPDA